MIAEATNLALLSLFARRFVAGISAEDALREAKRLNREGRSAVINFLGEDVRDEKQSLKTMQEYLRLIQEISAQHLKASIAIKLTQLGLLKGKTFCRFTVRKILEEAKARNVLVEFDMESGRYTKDTVDLFLEFHKEFPNIRLALQSYLLKTRSHLELLAAAKARVRICKGAYRESPLVAHQSPFYVKLNFLTLMTRAFEATPDPAIATHDEDLIQAARDRFKDQKDAFEFQMLRGINERLQTRLAKQGYRVRIYIPYGKEWLSYGIRRWRFLLSHLKYIL